MERESRGDALVANDEVTGLPGRRRFQERLERALAEARHGAGRACAVLVIDLDHFARVNDGRGRATGDELLRLAARRLVASVQEADTVARVGGDEFAVLLTEMGMGTEAGWVAERILGGFALPFTLGGASLFIGASVGVAVGDGAGGDDLLCQAELALHRAKELGRARWEQFDAAMHRRVMERLQTDLDLHFALDRDELRLVYQPIFELRGRRVVGMEALVRWQHPSRGTVMPDDFIPVAEHNGLILRLGAWVMQRVAHELPGWRSAHEITVGVNLSVRQLHDPGLLPALRRIASGNGSPARLRLEITESALMADPEAAARLLRQIHELGITLCIDDFGTGYSSLAYLLRLPLDALKIDRAFVGDLERRRESRQMVAAITRLAHALELEVVAEGVETEEQHRRLEALGVDHVQGFLFARPLDQLAAAALLAQP